MDEKCREYVSLSEVSKDVEELKADVKDIKGNKQKLITGIMGGVIITVTAAFILQVFQVFHW